MNFSSYEFIIRFIRYRPQYMMPRVMKKVLEK